VRAFNISESYYGRGKLSILSANIPADEYISELVGHIFWFWAIEMIRRDLRNRITHEPDAEVPLDAPFR
jgi:uncharacterized membrane protein YagU involved in acid resistance